MSRLSVPGWLLAVCCLLASSCGADPDERARQSHDRMVRVLAALAERAEFDNPYSGRSEVEEKRAALTAAGSAASWRLRLDTALAELRQGNERRAIEILTVAHEALRRGEIAPRDPALSAASIAFYLGVAWMRRGETENCCRNAVAESCILPLAGPAQHRNGEGSRQACFYLTEFLHNTPPTERWHLTARWLLNLAHMTLGSWPEGVPEAFRMTEMSEPGGEAPRFENIAGDLGIDVNGNAGGIIVDDFDGDDILDIVCSDWHPAAPLRFFRGRRDGTFEERTEESGLAGITGGLNLVPADYDNDGDLDFLVLRGAWWFEAGRHPNSLVRNEGAGRFVDVTFLAGLGFSRHPTQAAAWADYDLDGDLDLYVGNENSERAPSPSELFRNEGDGTFSEIGREAGVRNLRYAKAVSWGDIDDDGDPDLYVSNADGDNRLYQNLGDGTFVDVAPERGVTDPQNGFPAWFFDFDNDGALDLFASNYGTDAGHIAAHLLGIDLGQGRPRLYRGDGRGGFREVGERCGLTYPSLPMGANYGDLDNDGWLDIYLGTGDPEYHNLMPNLAYRNDSGRRFVDVTVASGLGHLQKGHGIAFADFDGDGDQDVFAVLGGAYPGDRFRNALFRNPGNGNHWLTLDLVGTTSSRTPIGARIRVVTVEGDRRRSIYRWVGSGGSFGASPMRQTIGLASAATVDRIEIRWPRTGRTQILTDPPVDRRLRITEGRPGYTTFP